MKSQGDSHRKREENGEVSAAWRSIVSYDIDVFEVKMIIMIVHFCA